MLFMHSGSVSKLRFGKGSRRPCIAADSGGLPVVPSLRGGRLRRALAGSGREISVRTSGVAGLVSTGPTTGRFLKMAAMSEDGDLERERRAAATEWVAKLSRTSIDTDQLQAFFAWRRDPANRRVWDAMEAGRKRVDRFVVRPETERFKVIDIWTGETAIIASTPQQHMSEEDALHMARLLNRSVKDGDRSVRR